MNIIIEDSGKRICWENNSNTICKQYNNIIMGYEILPDKTGVLMLEPYEDVGKNNAVIFNVDGSERWRLQYTPESGEGICFDRVGVTNGELNVIAIVSNRDVRFEVDLDNKNYKGVFSSR